MQFSELPVNALFTFHSFSDEVYRKVGDTSCLLISYPDEEIDEVLSMNQRVYNVHILVEKGSQADDIQPVPFPEPSVDRFQPITIIKEMKARLRAIGDRIHNEYDSLTVEELNQLKGMRVGLAYAVVFTRELAMHRFDKKEE